MLLSFKIITKIFVRRHVIRTYHGYVDCELHPYPHTDDQNDCRDGAQTDVGQTHKPEQLHDHHSQYDYLQNVENNDIVKSTT